jgi:hypothetical protein
MDGWSVLYRVSNCDRLCCWCPVNPSPNTNVCIVKMGNNEAPLPASRLTSPRPGFRRQLLAIHGFVP